MGSALGLGRAFTSLGQSLPALGERIDQTRGDMREQRIQNETLQREEEARRRREQALRQVGILGAEMYGAPAEGGPGRAVLPDTAMQAGPGTVGESAGQLRGPAQNLQQLSFQYADVPEVGQAAERAQKFSDRQISAQGLDELAAQLEKSENAEDQRMAQLLNLYRNSGQVDRAMEALQGQAQAERGGPAFAVRREENVPENRQRNEQTIQALVKDGRLDETDAAVLTNANHVDPVLVSRKLMNFAGGER